MEEILADFDSMMIYAMLDKDVNSSRFFNLMSDEDRVKFAIQYLCCEGESLKINQVLKSAEKATECIEEANRHFSTTPWQSLLEKYTQAVVYAPPGSSELARALNNRSAILYNGGLYSNSLLDIARALDIGCPDITKAKLCARKVKCVLALDRKRTSEVRMTAAGAGKVFPRTDYRELLPPTPEDNPKIKRASSAIEMRYSTKFGRHVVATRDIETGETLLVHRAYASVIEPIFRLQYCWNCSRRAWSGIPCHQCVDVIYCNETCRDMAWHDYHDIECSVIPAILQQNVVLADLMVLRLTLKAYKEAGTVENLKEELIKIDAIKDPITGSYNLDTFDDEKYVSIYTSPKSPPLSFDNSVRCAVTLYCLSSTTEILGERISNFHELLNNQLAIFIGGLMMTNYSICESSSYAINVINDNDKIIRYGSAMYPFVKLYNHSCDPTARKFDVQDTSAVVAVQKIKNGEQILLSYGPFFLIQPIGARREFLKRFHFSCDCKPCIKNWGPDSFSSFPSYKPNRLPADLQILLRRIRKEWTDIYTCKIDFTEIPSLISDIIRNIKMLQRKSVYPTQEMLSLKQGLITIYGRISLASRVEQH